MQYMDWKQTIDDAKANGGFTESAKVRAGSWSMCALAEKLGLDDAEKVRRVTDGNRELMRLGLVFATNVEDDDIDGAEDTYKQIMSTKL